MTVSLDFQAVEDALRNASPSEDVSVSDLLDALRVLFDNDGEIWQWVQANVAVYEEPDKTACEPGQRFWEQTISEESTAAAALLSGLGFAPKMVGVWESWDWVLINQAFRFTWDGSLWVAVNDLPSDQQPPTVPDPVYIFDQLPVVPLGEFDSEELLPLPVAGGLASTADTGHLWASDGDTWVDMGSMRGPVEKSYVDEQVANLQSQITVLSLLVNQL